MKHNLKSFHLASAGARYDRMDDTSVDLAICALWHLRTRIVQAEIVGRILLLTSR